MASPHPKIMEPGQYDEVATAVQWKTRSQFCAVIVLGGLRGDGFSVVSVPGLLRLTPYLLRELADHIEVESMA